MQEHFDEAYYQNGSERGTQYRDYLEGAKRNRTYFEIAQTIVELLKPRRALEIGCATGVVVGHLRTFGVDAYGLDVSQWAVDHRVTETVQLGSAESLPFADNYFDVVYSVHALEHLSEEGKDKAFAELARVCSGFQFHMMPMLESGPYVGDRFGHLLNLRTDPTHNLLYEREWWLQRFSDQGFHDTGVAISITHDNAFYELSSCQLLMSRKRADADLLRRIAAHNHSVAGALSLALNGNPGPGLDVHVTRLREQGNAQQQIATTSLALPCRLRRALTDTSFDEINTDRDFSEAKAQSQKRLIEKLRDEVERIPALERRARQLERTVAAAERRCTKLEEDLSNRLSELASLTRTLLETEEECHDGYRTAKKLQGILQAILNERAWWRFMPYRWLNKRRARRLSRLRLFDAKVYADQFTDVVEGGQDPLRHYVFHGIDEMRKGLRSTLE